MNAKRLIRPLAWFLIFVLAALALSSFFNGSNGVEEVDTARVVAEIEDGNVQSAKVIGGEQQKIELTLKDDSQISAQYALAQEERITEALDRQFENGELPDGYDVEVPQPSVWLSILGTLLPFLILGGLIFFFMTQMQGGGGRVMQFGKSRAKLASKDAPKTTFADVAGANEAVEELHEIKEFLQEPGKFQAVGAKIPKGVLLYGPPGTGKIGRAHV